MKFEEAFNYDRLSKKFSDEQLKDFADFMCNMLASTGDKHAILLQLACNIRDLITENYMKDTILDLDESELDLHIESLNKIQRELRFYVSTISKRKEE